LPNIPKELTVKEMTAQEVRAIRAVYAGEATPYEQKLTLKLIVNNFSRAHDVLYIPGDTHASTFIQGRAFVGAQLLKTLKLPIGALIDEEAEANVQS
jgi:hypothetical protein